MTETPEAITPEEFDFAKWMAGAYKPTRGSTVHQRGDLIAELDRIQEQIEIVDAVPEGERSLADVSTDRLREQYATIAQQFHDSGLFVKISGHTNEEKLEIAKALDAEVDAEIAELFPFDASKEPAGESDEPPVTGPKSKPATDHRHERSKDLTYCLMASALVSPKLTPAQLKQLHGVVGESEFSRVLQDYQLASNAINEPDADFLPKPSTPDETAE